jgi:1-acyl-sn-glycerol-3-phosphate acyltransferase
MTNHQKNTSAPVPAPGHTSIRVWLAQSFVRQAIFGFLKIFYRLRVIGQAEMPKEGGVLILPNHVTYIDAAIVAFACRRPVRFVVYDEFMKNRWMALGLRLFGSVPVSASRAKDALKTVVAALRAGDAVCLFPEGQLTRHGLLNPLKKGYELMARQADVPVLAMHMDQLWGSIFSFDRGLFFQKRPRQLPYPATVRLAAALPAKEATSERVRSELQRLSAANFAERTSLLGTIGQELRRLFRTAHRRVLLRGGGRDFTGSDLLATAQRAGDLQPSIGMDPTAENVLTLITLWLQEKVPVIDTELSAPSTPVSTRRPALWDSLRHRWPQEWFSQRIPHNETAVQWSDGRSLSHRQLLGQADQIVDTLLFVPGHTLRLRLSLDQPAALIIGLIAAWQAHVVVILDSCAATLTSLALGSQSDPAAEFTLVPGKNFLCHQPTGLILSLSLPHPPLGSQTAEPQLGWLPACYGRPLMGYEVENTSAGLTYRSPLLSWSGHQLVTLPDYMLEEDLFIKKKM